MDSYINYIAKINLNGKVLEIKRLFIKGTIEDILIDRDGIWYMTYISNGIKFCFSKDGLNWSKPITISENEKYRNGYVKFSSPSLAEMGDGRIFLLFTRLEQHIDTLGGYDFINRSLEVYYTILGNDGVWSEPILISVLKPDKRITLRGYGGSYIRWKDLQVSSLHPSSFTLKNGSIGIVAVDQNLTRYELNGIWFTYLKENKNWSKPVHLSFNTAHFRGMNPKIFYSFTREGYFLTYKNHDLQDILSVVFSQDLERWSKITTFFT